MGMAVVLVLFMCKIEVHSGTRYNQTFVIFRLKLFRDFSVVKTHDERRFSMKTKRYEYFIKELFLATYI